MKENAIDVVIVEPHQHALEHIHYILRRNARKKGVLGAKMMKSWTMVHFDSHPDLACPNDDIPIPAVLCFTPREKTNLYKKHEHATTFMEMKESQRINDDDDDGDGGDSHQNEDDFPNGKNLYELLDTSQSGIAEWIIPLVFAGGLNKLYWLKNDDWCDQFRNGTYKIPVGAWIPPKVNDIHNDSGSNSDQGSTVVDKDEAVEVEVESFLDLPETASVKTSFRHNYYLDDDSVVPDDDLLLKQELKLIVSDLRKHNNDDILSSSILLPSRRPLIDGKTRVYEEGGVDEADNFNYWTLDVCLDYFICSNPFITELETIDKSITKNLTRAVNDSNFRKMIMMTSPSSVMSTVEEEKEEDATIYQSMSKQFQNLVCAYFRNFSMISNSKFSTEKVKKYSLLNEQEYFSLYNLYTPSSLGEEIWDEITSSMDKWCSCHNQNEKSNLCEIIINALPSMTLPHPIEMQNVSSPELSLEMKSKLKLFGEDLQHCRWCNDEHSIKGFLNTPPSIVTIARSSDDGFTPPIIVENLQKGVLNEIHKAYCDCNRDFFNAASLQILECDSCNINLVLDYGAHEGSTIG
jgi:hypothetical protein